MFTTLLLFMLLLIAGTLFTMSLIEFIFTANIFLIIAIFILALYFTAKVYIRSIDHSKD